MTIPTLALLSATILFAVTMVHAGVMDLTTLKIRNSLVLLLLGAYAVLAPLAGFAVQEIGLSAAVAAGVLVFSFLLFTFGWIGGGDAKLAAVTALWFGAEHTPAYLVQTALLGGVFALALLQFRALALPAFLASRTWVVRLHSSGAGVPYGVAMAVAALAVFPHTRWMTTL